MRRANRAPRFLTDTAWHKLVRPGFTGRLLGRQAAGHRLLSHVLGMPAAGGRRAQTPFGRQLSFVRVDLFPGQTPGFIGSLRGLQGESAPHHHPKTHPSQANHAWVSRAPPAACRPEATPPPQRHRRHPPFEDRTKKRTKPLTVDYSARTADPALWKAPPPGPRRNRPASFCARRASPSVTASPSTRRSSCAS